MSERSWQKTLRLVLRQGVNPFDEANEVSFTYLSSLGNILERLEILQSQPKGTDELPGSLSNFSDLKHILSQKLRKQSQDTLKEIFSIVEQMEVSFKVMLRLLEEADDVPDWSQSTAREHAEGIVSTYGHEYWRKRQLIETIDLSISSASEVVKEILACWSSASSDTFLDVQLLESLKQIQL